MKYTLSRARRGALALVAVGALAAGGVAQASDPVSTVEALSQADYVPYADTSLRPTTDAAPGAYVAPQASLKAVNPVLLPDLAAADAAAPSSEIVELHRSAQTRSSQSEADPGVTTGGRGFRCAVNAYPPVRKGVSRDYRVQGRAVNVCTGDIVRHSVTACIAYFGRDRVWHSTFCGSKMKYGPGTIDYRPSSDCLSGLRYWRTEAFGSATDRHGVTHTSRVDVSPSEAIRC